MGDRRVVEARLRRRAARVQQLPLAADRVVGVLLQVQAPDLGDDARDVGHARFGHAAEDYHRSRRREDVLRALVDQHAGVRRARVGRVGRIFLARDLRPHIVVEVEAPRVAEGGERVGRALTLEAAAAINNHAAGEDDGAVRIATRHRVAVVALPAADLGSSGEQERF